MPFAFMANNETYKKKYAKVTLKEWCDMSKGEMWTITGQNLNWTSNREENAWSEYPIIVNGSFNSIENNLDEIFPRDINAYGAWDGFVPSYNECKKNNLEPITVMDIVLPHKGSPKYFIYICDTNPISNDELKKLKKLGIEALIEIDAEWILRQTGIPSKLEIKRWLI